MTDTAPRIAVLVPCYKVERHVLDVLARIPQSVWRIYCIDDACPNRSGRLIEEKCADSRVKVLYHESNRGVGGAVKTGYRAARADGCTIAVKIDGDGQMDPELIDRFVAPILAGQCDYTKGNRFYYLEDVEAMPVFRMFGNAALSFLSKLSSGYWSLFDPTNGYTALHLALLDVYPLDKVHDRYFFESDMLFRLNIARAVVKDIPMRALYADERSNLSVTRVFLPFLGNHLRNLGKRLFYSYFLRDFQVASIEIITGPVLLLFGVLYGGYHWWQSAHAEAAAPTGTVVIPALAIILGVQLILSALNFDLRNMPDDPVHPYLPTGEERDGRPGTD